MTMEREESDVFDASPALVLDAIRAVLAQPRWTYSYRKTVELEQGRTIATVLWPRLWPLILSTKIFISLDPCGMGTRVTVRTQSQSGIPSGTPDVSTSTGGYINNLLSAIGDELPKTAREWLAEFGWELAEPGEVSQQELDTVMGHDEFWEWSSGKVDFNQLTQVHSSWLVWLAVALLGLIWVALRLANLL